MLIVHTKVYERGIQLCRGSSRKWSEILKSISINNWNERIRLQLVLNLVRNKPRKKLSQINGIQIPKAKQEYSL